MDFFEFVVGSEWPFVVGGTIVMFRRQIRRLLNHMHLKKVNVMGNEVELEPDLGIAERLTENLTVTEAPDSATISGNVVPSWGFGQPTFIHGVRVSAAWMRLMAYMRILYERDANSDGPRKLKWREPKSLQELAAELGLDPSEIGAFTALEAAYQRMTRTATPEITAEEAKRFEDTVARLYGKLRLP